MSQSDKTSYSLGPLCGLIAFVHWCQGGRVTLKDLICNWAQLQNGFLISMGLGRGVENQVMVRSSTSKQLQLDLAVGEADNI